MELRQLAFVPYWRNITKCYQMFTKFRRHLTNSEKYTKKVCEIRLRTALQPFQAVAKLSNWTCEAVPLPYRDWMNLHAVSTSSREPCLSLDRCRKLKSNWKTIWEIIFVNVVALKKSCNMSRQLQRSASVQPRTDPLRFGSTGTQVYRCRNFPYRYVLQ